MPLSAVSVLVVAQSSSKIPEGLMNNPVYFELNITGVLMSPQPNQERNKLQRPNSNFRKPLKKIQNIVRSTRSPRQQ